MCYYSLFHSGLKFTKTQTADIREVTETE